MDRASQIKGKVTKEQNHFVMWAMVGQKQRLPHLA